MTKFLIRTSVAVLMLWISQAAYADSFTFTTLPVTGDVSGPVGSTVGWGYTITNQSLTDWLVTTGLTADLFDQGTPNTLFDFPILAPGSTATLAFDSLGGSGLYELTWDATAHVGFTNNGAFNLSAEWWDGDPFAGGNFLDSASDQQAVYSATVTGDNGSSAVPEPSSIVLLGMGCILIAFQKKTLGRKSNSL